jgi:hypothetical protein
MLLTLSGQVLFQHPVPLTHSLVLSPLCFLLSKVYAVSFWGYDIGQRIVKSFKNEEDGRPLNLTEISIAGGISGRHFNQTVRPTMSA